MAKQDFARKLQIVKDLEQLSNQLIYECREIGVIPTVLVEYGYNSPITFTGRNGFVIANSDGTCTKIENFSYHEFCEIVKKLPLVVQKFRDNIAREKERIIFRANQMHGDILSLLTTEGKPATTNPYR